jgi:hypothetical protein
MVCVWSVCVLALRFLNSFLTALYANQWVSIVLSAVLKVRVDLQLDSSRKRGYVL